MPAAGLGCQAPPQWGLYAQPASFAPGGGRVAAAPGPPAARLLLSPPLRLCLTAPRAPQLLGSGSGSDCPLPRGNPGVLRRSRAGFGGSLLLLLCIPPPLRALLSGGSRRCCSITDNLNPGGCERGAAGGAGCTARAAGSPGAAAAGIWTGERRRQRPLTWPRTGLRGEARPPPLAPR